MVHGPGEALLVLRLAGVAAAVPLLMRLPLPRVRALLEPRRVPRCPDPRRVDWLIGAALAVLHAGRPVIRPGCLTRGVTLYYILRRAGVDVSLCFGLGQRGEGDGHCWLEKDGAPFLEPRDPRPLYLTMYAFSGHGRRRAQGARQRAPIPSQGLGR